MTDWKVLEMYGIWRHGVGGTGQKVRTTCDCDYEKALQGVTNLTGLTCQSQLNTP